MCEDVSSWGLWQALEPPRKIGRHSQLMFEVSVLETTYTSTQPSSEIRSAWDELMSAIIPARRPSFGAFLSKMT